MSSLQLYYNSPRHTRDVGLGWPFIKTRAFAREFSHFSVSVRSDNIEPRQPFVASSVVAASGPGAPLRGLVYEGTSGVLKVFLENVIHRQSVTYTEHAKRKTVTGRPTMYNAAVF